MSSTNETSPLRRPGFIAAAAVVGIIILLGVGLAVSNLWAGRTQPPTPPSSPPVVASPSATATTAAPQASICGLPGYEPTGTVSKAPEAIWTLVGTTAAPGSSSAGPGLVDDDGYRRCYAHTPTGAVFAAANYVAMGSVRTIQPKVAENSIVPGPGRDKLLAQPVPSESGGGVRIQVSGFRVLSYTGTAASVDIAMRTSNGAMAGQVFELQWEGGDWKLRVTTEGDMLSRLVQIRDLAGYIPWAGA